MPVDPIGPATSQPEQRQAFMLSGRDDFRGALANMGVRDSWTQFLFTMPSAGAVINALLAGITGSPP